MTDKLFMMETLQYWIHRIWPMILFDPASYPQFRFMSDDCLPPETACIWRLLRFNSELVLQESEDKGAPEELESAGRFKLPRFPGMRRERVAAWRELQFAKRPRSGRWPSTNGCGQSGRSSPAIKSIMDSRIFPW
jgi:hypothetical protein